MFNSNLTFDPFSEVTVFCLSIAHKMTIGHTKAKDLNFYFIAQCYDNNDTFYLKCKQY